MSHATDSLRIMHAEQSNPDKEIGKSSGRHLCYLAKFTNGIITQIKSDIILWECINRSQLSEKNTKSKEGIFSLDILSKT